MKRRFIGNALIGLFLIHLIGLDIPLVRTTVIEHPRPTNPCIPSPCGPYSVCRVQHEHPVCSCQAGYIGVPPNCHPECVISAECPQDLACINQHCTDPCPGTCGYLARCHTVNHNPICSCPAGYVGDPFVKCIHEESKPWIII